MTSPATRCDLRADVARPRPGGPVGRPRAATTASRSRLPSGRRTAWFVERVRPPRPRRGARTASATSSPGGSRTRTPRDAPDLHAARCRPDRLAPGLRPRRRRVRRSARRRRPHWLPSTSCGTAGCTPGAPAGHRGVRRGGGVALPACLPGFSARHRPALLGARPDELSDRDGVALGDVVEAGHGSDLLADVGVYVELHVEQGRDLVDRGAAVGVALGDLAARPLPLRRVRRSPTTRARPGWRTGTTRC